MVDVEAALLANARSLAAICSKDTYASQYPAFASIFADAESLKYYPRRSVVSDADMVMRIEAQAWRNNTMDTTSMILRGANQGIMGPYEPSYTPAVPVSADVGGSMGGTGTGGGDAGGAAPQ